MELAQKFEVVAILKSIAQPPPMEVDKTYRILHVFKRLRLTRLIALAFRDDEGIIVCLLSSSYSLVVNDSDISELNAEEGKYKLICRKKCCDKCHSGNYRVVGFCSIDCHRVMNINKGNFKRYISVFLLQLDLTQRFRFVSSELVTHYPSMELDKPYPF
jgi:hypothetical protein